MKNKKRYLLIFLLGLLLPTSCERLELIPENQFTDTNYWTTLPKAQTALNTAYSQMMNSNYFFYNEALSDNAYNGRGDNAGAASIAAGIFDASLGRFKDEWNSRYAGIKTCNLILSNIDKIQNADPNQIERLRAEARVLRAYQHFMLTTWFGDIPLLDHDPSLEEATTITRTPHAEVVSFILNELNETMAVLPTKQQYSAAESGKITSGAVLALKARVLLYESRWDEVASATDALMNGERGTYALFPSYSGLFLPENENNSEDILSLQYTPVDRMWGEYFDLAPLSAGARLNAMAPTQELVDSYLMLNGKKITDSGSNYDENNPYINRDPRLTATVVYHNYQWTEKNGQTHIIYIKPGSDPEPTDLDEYSPGSSKTVTGYYMRKYYDPQHMNNLQSGLNLMMIRYADVLLMNAEAKNELGQFTAETWAKTIGALRVRAGFKDPAATAYPGTLSKDQMRQLIRNERRTELGMEGLRIFDIRRWKIGDQVLNGWAHGAKYGVADEDNGYLRVNFRTFDPAKHYLWPIPRDERNINKNLTQNPGY